MLLGLMFTLVYGGFEFSRGLPKALENNILSKKYKNLLYNSRFFGLLPFSLLYRILSEYESNSHCQFEPVKPSHPAPRRFDEFAKIFSRLERG